MRRGVVLLGLLTLTASLSSAGDLEPPGPPAPTMKSLDEIPPTWSQVLDSADGEPDGCNSTRFKCVMGGDAVLDLETGLLWERTPSAAAVGWVAAIDICDRLSTGNRAGWRLPRIEELRSLVDPSQSDPALPLSHPFLFSDQTNFWSSSTDHSSTDFAKSMLLVNGAVSFQQKPGPTPGWCVRGGAPNIFTSQPNSVAPGAPGARE
jgi:hypothetical protein